MEGPWLQLTAHIEALRDGSADLATGTPVADILAQICIQDVQRLQALQEAAVAKRRLAQSSLNGFIGDGHVTSDMKPEAPSPTADFMALAAESGGLLASIDARILAYQRDLRTTLKLLTHHSQPSPDSRAPLPVAPSRFRTVKGCAEYLHVHHRRMGTTCPQCGHDHFSLLATRVIQQCSRCGRQVSLRVGSVFEGSKINLPTWFLAIQVVLRVPSISAAQLAEHLGGMRQDTARQMQRRISAARFHPRRTLLLAGLDEHFEAAAVCNALPTASPNETNSATSLTSLTRESDGVYRDDDCDESLS